MKDQGQKTRYSARSLCYGLRASAGVPTRQAGVPAPPMRARIQRARLVCPLGGRVFLAVVPQKTDPV